MFSRFTEALKHFADVNFASLESTSSNTGDDSEVKSAIVPIVETCATAKQAIAALQKMKSQIWLLLGSATQVGLSYWVSP
ncbi:MAG: hypothetical protein EBQ64_03115 [Acidimicrobiia bacterium]|nr:hypothetical protein [Acidimicrobiia bacterium]